MIKIVPRRNETVFIDDEIDIQIQPSFTHKMHIDEERVYDYVDEIVAYKQMVYKCINTERGIYPIYPNFGVKKNDLFGRPKELAFIKLTRRIEDALMLDDRTVRVYDFEYVEEWSKDENLGMRFKVDTIFDNSDLEIEEVLNLG